MHRDTDSNDPPEFNFINQMSLPEIVIIIHMLKFIKLKIPPGLGYNNDMPTDVIDPVSILRSVGLRNPESSRRKTGFVRSAKITKVHRFLFDDRWKNEPVSNSCPNLNFPNFYLYKVKTVRKLTYLTSNLYELKPVPTVTYPNFNLFKRLLVRTLAYPELNLSNFSI